MDDLGAEIREFHRLVVGQRVDHLGLRHEPRIGAQHAVHVGPDDDLAGVEQRAEDRGREVAAVAAERRLQSLGVGRDEAGDDQRAGEVRRDLRVQVARATGPSGSPGRAAPTRPAAPCARRATARDRSTRRARAAAARTAAWTRSRRSRRSGPAASSRPSAPGGPSAGCPRCPGSRWSSCSDELVVAGRRRAARGRCPTWRMPQVLRCGRRGPGPAVRPALSASAARR